MAYNAAVFAVADPGLWLDMFATGAVVAGAIWWLTLQVIKPSSCGACPEQQSNKTSVTQLPLTQLSLASRTDFAASQAAGAVPPISCTSSAAMSAARKAADGR